MDVDEYGIPANMFGRVPEAFYGLLGRVVMVASLLELRLLDLLTELDQAPQDEHAGKSGSELIGACRSRLPGYDQDFRANATSVLTHAQEALNRRHAAVHSIWPRPQVDNAFGWRPVTRKRRDDPKQPYNSVVVRGSELPDLITATVLLVHKVVAVREAASAARLGLD